MRRRLLPAGVLGTLVTLVPLAATGNSTNADSLLQHASSSDFIEQMTREHGFARKDLEAMFAEARLRPSVIERITRPAEALPWHKYRKIFMGEKRIRGGAEFWRTHEDALNRAEQEFGVAPEVIVAIIGVETLYGTYLGKDPVLESLATLAFDYPRRSEFFTSELEQFLLLSREEGFEPLAVKGSYAGAMGYPQFISSSYRRLAIDFDGDDRRDLLGNPVDAIGSVANYLSKHGWRRGETVAVEARVSGNGYRSLVDKGLKPTAPFSELDELGVTPMESARGTRAALVTMDAGDSTEYWLGFDNFYAITRYNHSALYALAVHQLSLAILDAMGTP